MSNAKPGSPATDLVERLGRLSQERRALLLRNLAEKQVCGFELVAQSLFECGISHIYGVAGQPTEEILPACFRWNIRPIGVYHQTAAVCMATAQNYQAGCLVAAALVSAGPAATNAITGLLVARDNGWPVIVLGGRRSSFQKCDVLPMIRPVTKYAVDVPSTGSIVRCIHEACNIATSGRPGPAYLDLHEDVLRGRVVAAPSCPANLTTPTGTLPSVSDLDVERTMGALLSARRPALLLGKGVRWTVVPAQLQALTEALGLPFITSPLGRGFVPDDHPLCFNRARTALQSRADVVLILGARLNWIFRHGAELSPKAHVFRVDVHREDEDGGEIQTDFIQADAGDFVARLLIVTTSRHDEIADISRRRCLDEWHHSLRTASEKYQHVIDQRMNCDAQPMSPYRMMKEVRDALPRDAICITDGNVSMIAAQMVIPAFRPASRMDAGTNACMGVGIPFAIGAKVACPDRVVVAVTGDYGFSLSAMEMEVCVRHNIPIVVVVANNQGNSGALKQRTYFPKDSAGRVMMFQPGIQYDRMLKMFGGQGTTITDPALLKPTLEAALSAGTPYCINVVIDPETPLPNAWGEQASDRETES